MRIALIEGNQSPAQGIWNALRDQGHAVDRLPDGDDGDRLLAAEGADLAIIDVTLPGMTGFDIVRAMKPSAR